jgi:excinuclease ABC subunit A
MSHHLRLTGVRENNLKNLDLTLEHNKLIVVTGVSGSGKSTLAFDTIYAEGGRRYIETFSPYTRQFLDKLHQPDLDSVEGVRPALALEQRNKTTSSRSTVGTSTEINDYLKLIWPHLAQGFCPSCNKEVRRYSTVEAGKEIQNILSGGEKQVIIAFPLEIKREANPEALREVISSQGFIRYIKDGEVRRIEELDEIPERLFIALDRIVPGSESRISPSVAQAYHYGKGVLALFTDSPTPRILTEFPSCQGCGATLPTPRASMFSFNSALGACKRCSGFGKVLEVDLSLCIPDPTKSIAEGAVAPWSTKAAAWEAKELKKFCESQGIDQTVPWQKLLKKERELIMYGDGRKRGFGGLHGWFEWLKTKRHKMHVRVFLSRYRRESTCPDCGGSRLNPEASLFRIGGKTIQEIWQLPFSELSRWVEELSSLHAGDPVLDVPLAEISSRVSYLNQIGLPYLTLDRQSKTLSGGEFQRVNLTSILGSRLANTTLVLDEPTIGLHPRDTKRLIEALELLRDRGNTLVVVEHEPEVMLAADELLDIGPGPGESGGRVVYQGQEITKAKDSITGRYLSGQLTLSRKLFRSPEKRKLTIRGASCHNIENLDVEIPLNRFVVVTGVSGSGKSTLVHHCLYESARHLLDQKGGELTTVKAIEGLSALKDIVLVDQSPIGKTPRSNPATYTGIWEIIRELLAETPRAIELGLNKSSFSFNVDGGRCPQCKGAGSERVEMQFLADVFVECEKCGGSRFKDSVLSVNLAGKNVQEILKLSLEECLRFLGSVADGRKLEKLRERLNPLLELGLGYLRLGQPLSEVSGGEAQRIKLASYLGEKQSGSYLFILDEPTTGLHPFNIQSLLTTFDKLLAEGHSILCVEHNKDLILQADWLIDLGPEGGALGGKLIAEGAPQELLKTASLRACSQTLKELAAESVAERKKSAVRRKRRVSEPPISIVGAREHNLKNISLEIPTNELTVITGVSGSGKSTLAFDILFQEGQRRYIDCLSPYARQYLTHLSRAEVDRVDHIPPTIAVSQKTAPPHGVSTIATTTEIYQFLRLLFSKVGTQHCPKHGLPIQGLSKEAICEEILDYAKGRRTFIFAPVISGRKGYYNDLFQRAVRAELREARVNGKLISISDDLRLERHKLHWISLLIASFSTLKSGGEMLTEAVEQALHWSGGTVEVVIEEKKGEPRVFSTDRVCPKCKRGFRQLDPQDFSFRSQRGLCQRCGGRGVLGEDEICPVCEGSRLSEVGRTVTLFGKKIFDLARLSAPELLNEIEQFSFSERLSPVVGPVLVELKHRLKVIDAVGLGYLSLNRDASTLSGGEAQRLRLARTLGSPLTGICYVLDEPTIGLHPQDHERLMEILFSLRDRGNTVVVVEHDEETICLADHIIDIGPGGGAGGGEVVCQGAPAEILRNEVSETAAALRSRLGGERKFSGGSEKSHHAPLLLEGASANNLKNLDVKFPLGALTVVCGVSGAGKSSLVHGSLVPAIFAEFEGERPKRRTFTALKNHDPIVRYLEVDQAPVGKTSASCPASYLGIFDEIRKVFAMTTEAKARGWSASHFSYNSGKGRCQHCEGKGFLKVPMSFLPDAVSPCEVCSGLRYDEPTLEVKFQGLSIGEILKKTMSEALQLFSNHKKIRRTLEYVNELGIGYLSLGQPTHTLSGGEIQRIKLALELGAREAVDTLYILDEPTIGLHMKDVDRLMKVVRKLIDQGNTVIIIEHNLDVIAEADHLIEMGPGPGEAGGEVIFSGTPRELLRVKRDTPTKRALSARRDEQLVRALTNRTQTGSPEASGSSGKLPLNEAQSRI